MRPSSVEDALVRCSLGGDRDPMPLLHGQDPDLVSFTTWRALLRLEDRLDPSSMWAVRVRGLRRRSYYAAVAASRVAVPLSDSLTASDVIHSVTGDLALAVGYGQPSGDQVITGVQVWVDPAMPLDRMVVRAAAALPGTRWDVSAGSARSMVMGMPVALVQGWSSWSSAAPAYGAPPGTVLAQTPAGPLAIHDPAAEAYRILTLRGAPSQEAWLLSLRAVVVAHPTAWDGLAVLARTHQRAAAVAMSWRKAARLGLAPPLPGLPRDPTGELLRQSAQRGRQWLRTRLR